MFSPSPFSERSSANGTCSATEAGVALITALLIVAVVTSTAVAIASRQYLDIRQTANLLGRDQAYLIALGGEFWAKQVLEEDLEEDLEDGRVDTLEEIWASKPAAIAVQGGTIHGRIHDQQALLNLNNLIDRNGKQNPQTMARLRRLLENLSLDPNLAVAIADWIDDNTVIAGSEGAEDETYLSRTPPYFTGNQPMLSITELALIKGFDGESVALLKPWVVALPTATDININTAPMEIVQILAPDLSRLDAQTLVNARQGGWFESIKDFLKHPVLREKKISKEGLSVASSYFRANLRAEVGQGKVRLFSLFKRGNNSVTLLRRRQTLD